MLLLSGIVTSCVMGDNFVQDIRNELVSLIHSTRSKEDKGNEQQSYKGYLEKNKS
jgi:hypothetical protein